MKRVLITGRTGFIGRNIIEKLKENFLVFAPSRHELNLKCLSDLKYYLQRENIDVVVHCANPNPVKNESLDLAETFLRDSLFIFMNLYNLSEYYEKLIYLGSGAEYDKSYPIVDVKEVSFGVSIPKDDYGLAKYVMNELARKSKKVYNLRVFACYGPYDHSSKFITHCIQCCLREKDITIRQNCMFDYLHVDDLATIVSWMIEYNASHQDYNVASGEKVSLLNIAREVKRQMRSKSEIKIQIGGWNREYSADITRLIAEYPFSNSFLTLKAGIRKQIEHEKEHFDEKASC